MLNVLLTVDTNASTFVPQRHLKTIAVQVTDGCIYDNILGYKKRIISIYFKLNRP